MTGTVTRPDADAAVARRALTDPSVLPSDLSVRFAVLMALIMASTGSIYGHLWLLSLPVGGRGATCLSATDVQRFTGISPDASAQFLGWTNDALACEPRYAPGLAGWGAAGTALVLVATYLGYRVMPWWRVRYPNGFLRVVTRRAGRMPLLPLVDRDPEAARVVADLAAELGVPAPELLVSRVPGASFVFGTGRRVSLCLDKRLLRRRRTDPVAFAAVVRHELAHVRNRDNRQTCLAIAAWRSFCAFAVLPYLVFGLAPAGATLFTWDNLHLVATVAALVTVVYLSRLAMLRTRELQADATAGQFDVDGAFREFLGRASETGSTWRPVFLRRHPSLEARRRAADDPLTVPAVPAAQLFGAGIAVSVLSADSAAVVWYAFIASRVGGPMRLSTVHPDNALFLAVFAVIVVANLLSVGALAWLAAVSAWRAQVRSLVRPVRPRTVLFSVSFAAGVLVGEPLSITYADADVLGAFEGLRYGDGRGALFAALTLVLMVAAVYRWSWENAGAWLPVVRGSLRRACRASAVVAGAAVLVLFAAWWAMKDTPTIGDIYLWSPGLADLLTFRYWSAPGASWLLALYLPVDLPGARPGEAVVLLAPLLVLVIGLLRPDTVTTPDWLRRAGGVLPLPRPRATTGRPVLVGLVCGGSAIAVGTALSVWLRHLAGAPAIALNHDSALFYFTRANIDVIAALAVVSASIVVFRSSAVPATMAVLAASVTAGVAALGAPAAVLTGMCGLSRASGCASAPLSAYSIVYGVLGTRLFVTSSIATTAAVALILLGRHAWRSAPSGRRPEQATTTGRPRPLLVWTAGLFIAASLLATTYFDLP